MPLFCGFSKKYLPRKNDKRFFSHLCSRGIAVNWRELRNFATICSICRPLSARSRAENDKNAPF
jgi:hypothetical protein